jgi:hypothetical protein
MEARFFGRRGFNQHVGKYFLSKHQTVSSRSLRMTRKELLPNTEAIVKNLNLMLILESGNPWGRTTKLDTGLRRYDVEIFPEIEPLILGHTLT